MQRLPDPAAEVVTDPHDALHLAAARTGGGRWLVAFNVRDYRPAGGSPTIALPGPLLVRIRAQVAVVRL